MDQGTPTPGWVLWLPVATAVLSGGFAFLGVVVGQSMTTRREWRRQAKQFQIDTIVELLDALSFCQTSMIYWHTKIRSGQAPPPDDVLARWGRIKVLLTRVEDETAKKKAALYSDKFLELIYQDLLHVQDRRSGDLEGKPEAAGMTAELLELYTGAEGELGDTLRFLHRDGFRARRRS